MLREAPVADAVLVQPSGCPTVGESQGTLTALADIDLSGGASKFMTKGGGNKPTSWARIPVHLCFRSCLVPLTKPRTSPWGSLTGVEFKQCST